MSKMTNAVIGIVAAIIAWSIALIAAGLVADRVPPVDKLVSSVLKRSGLQVAASQPAAPAVASTTQQKDKGEDPRPVLPGHITAVVGTPLRIYYDNLVLVMDPDSVRIDIEAEGIHGENQRRLWIATLDKGDIGTHKLVVHVRGWDGKTIAEAESTLEVLAANPLEAERNVLLVGDSITHQGRYPNALAARLEAISRGKVHFVGTAHPKASTPIDQDAAPGVFYEGYGGWTWHRFASHYLPEQEKLYGLPWSPFVFAGADKPVLDVGRYLHERAKIDRLDAAVFLLGLNDTFGASPDDPKSLDQIIEATLSNADKLLRAFREASPDAWLLVALPPPFTRSGPTFRYKYGAANPEFGDPWRHRRIQHALVRRLMEHIQRAGMRRVAVIPSYMGIDIVDGYWIDDAGHPNEIGAVELAESILPGLYEAISSPVK